MRILLLITTSLFALSSCFKLTFDLPPNVKGWLVPKWQSGNSYTYVIRNQVQSELDALQKDDDLLQYYLWTDKNPKKAQRIISGNATSLHQSNFNKSLPTRLMVHGIKASHNSEVCTLIRDAYLQTGPHNYICMDWSKIAYNTIPAIRFAIPSMGQDLGKFIEFLLKEGQMQKMHFVLDGHSYGTQVAGYAAKYTKSHNIILRFMVVLDPASALFPYEDCATRVCKDDVEFMESVQTTRQPIGYAQPIGHGAFYPHGGYNQPACPPQIVNGSCNHFIAYHYYAEAIVKHDLFAEKCSSVVNAWFDQCDKSSLGVAQVGKDVSIGVFYVPVHSQPPYGNATS